jgi:hypothetical protein
MPPQTTLAHSLRPFVREHIAFQDWNIKKKSYPPQKKDVKTLLLNVDELHEIPIQLIVVQTAFSSTQRVMMVCSTKNGYIWSNK